jgi:hypothetical protein
VPNFLTNSHDRTFLTGPIFRRKVWSSSQHFQSRHTRRKPGPQSYGSSPPPRRRPSGQLPTPRRSLKTAEPPTPGRLYAFAH